MAENTPAGWYGDPSRRHESRYWDGVRWTDQVASGGVTASDPVPGRDSPIAGASGADSNLTRGERQSAQRQAQPQGLWPASRSTGAVVLLIGGALLILGALLPWATASIGFIKVSAAGTDGDGVITLLIGVGVLVVGWVALKPRPHQVVVILGLLAGVAAGGISIYDIANVSSHVNSAQARSSLVHASVGLGLWLTALAAAGVFAGAIMKAKEAGREPSTG
jgi:hypothetical protein